MEKDRLKAALWYQSHGYSIIPLKLDKHPYIKWTPYQTKRALESEIRGWWEKWPSANIAIITGELSDVMVVDVDSREGQENFNEFVSDSLTIPTTTTPTGCWHYYFKYRPGLTSTSDVNPCMINKCDVKTDGGYVVAPPGYGDYEKDGIKIKGHWSWLNGLNLYTQKPPEMPQVLFDILEKSKNKYRPNSINSGFKHGCGLDGSPQSPQMSTNVHNLFKGGSRDNDLFHVANCCIKGGMSDEYTAQVIDILATNCDPPFSKKEAEIKVKSALSREIVRSGSITQEVRELIQSTSGHIMSTYVHTCLQMSTKNEKKACSMALSRFVDEGLLERTGRKAGEFRIVNETAEPVDWKSSREEWAKIYLPWKLDDIIDIPEGGIILLMGNPGAGKTAALMHIARYNMRNKWNVHYLSSEISEGAFKKRAVAYKELTLDHWNVNFYYDPPMVDTIKGGKGNLYILDYVEIYDNFWQVGKMMSDIYKKLNGGVAVIAIQKRPGSDVGLGGQFTQFKPALTLALEWQKVKIIKARDVKDAHMDKYGSPNGKEYHFKMIDNRTKYIEERWWTHEFKGA